MYVHLSVKQEKHFALKKETIYNWHFICQLFSQNICHPLDRLELPGRSGKEPPKWTSILPTCVAPRTTTDCYPCSILLIRAKRVGSSIGYFGVPYLHSPISRYVRYLALNYPGITLVIPNFSGYLIPDDFQN